MKYLYPKYYHNIINDKNIICKCKFKLYKNFKSDEEVLKIKAKQNELSKENYYYFEEQEKILTKKQIDLLNKYQFPQFTKNNYYISKKYNIGNGWSNAFRKMYEICVRTKIITNENIKHFDICGFPGSFIFAINYYLATNYTSYNYDWFLQSYLDNSDDIYLGDKYHLKKKYPEKFLLKNNGDISNVEEIKYYISYFKDKKRNLVTADCGINKCTEIGYDREKYMTKLFFGTLITSLGTLDIGGNFFTKYYHIYMKILIYH